MSILGFFSLFASSGLCAFALDCQWVFLLLASVSRLLSSFLINLKELVPKENSKHNEKREDIRWDSDLESEGNEYNKLKKCGEFSRTDGLKLEPMPRTLSQ